MRDDSEADMVQTVDGEGGMVGRRLGRYVLYDAIAAGGMASVHFGRLLGPVGFARTVAIKRLHPHHARDPEFVSMFLDEARLAARVQHPNVVSTLDIVTTSGEVFLVMDYVQGDSLQGLFKVARRHGTHLSLPVLSSVICGMLHGLHAAHEAKSDRGEPLMIVHRDVSPQNVLVGEDGVARLADFGVAKATWRMQATREGVLKGKLSYMSPEQVKRETVDRRTDVYAAAVVLWEGIAGRKLHGGDDPGAIMAALLMSRPDAPSRHRSGVPPELDEIVMRGLATKPEDRFQTALEMATQLERVVPPASQTTVAAWVRQGAADILARRASRLATIEATPSHSDAHARLSHIVLDSPSAVRRMSDAPTTPGVASSTGSAARIAGAGPGDARARARERRAVLGGAIALGAAIGALAVASISRRPSSNAAPAPSLAPPPRESGGPAAPVSAPERPSIAFATASAATVLPSATTAPVTSATASHRVPHEPVSTAKRQDCDPPYTIDPGSRSADGQPVKRFKLWCL